MAMEQPDPSKVKYWIPRSELLNCFQEVIQQKQRGLGSECKIRVMYESSCEGLYIPNESTKSDTTSVATACSSSDPHRLHVRITTTSSTASPIPSTSEVVPDRIQLPI